MHAVSRSPLARRRPPLFLSAANVIALHAALGCTPTCPEFTAASIDRFDRVGDIETDISEDDDEVVGRAVFQEAETFPGGQTQWTFGFEDSPTVLVLGFPSGIPLATPPSSGCCDVRLPATRSVRREVQVFADDGLWLEVSTPFAAGRTTEGMHASFEDEPTFECRLSGGESTRRHPLRFSFADAPALFGETRTGEIDGVAVIGHVLSDALFMDSGTPVAIVGRE